MLVLRFNLPRENRGEEFNGMVKRIVNHIGNDLGLEGVKIMSDKDGVEITTKPDSRSNKDDVEELMSIELLVSKNLVINNATIGEEEGYQAIKSELAQFIKT